MKSTFLNVSQCGCLGSICDLFSSLRPYHSSSCFWNTQAHSDLRASVFAVPLPATPSSNSSLAQWLLKPSSVTPFLTPVVNSLLWFSVCFTLIFYYLSTYHLSPPLECKHHEGRDCVCLVHYCRTVLGPPLRHNKYLWNDWMNQRMNEQTKVKERRQWRKQRGR